jgi:phosphoribosylanthranilate isomerase
MIPVKICGITRLADAISAVELGASAIGFIFYEKSPRAITLNDARAISEKLPASLARVGVFVNSPVDFIERSISNVPLDALQLHGDEPPQFCDQFNLPVLKGIQISDEKSLREMKRFDVDGFLLDTASNGTYGGTGRTFDWSLIDDKSTEVPIILSGGLRPENVLSAVETVRPSAIDVNSGVESKPGVKDHEKIHRLVDQLSKTIDTGFSFG